MELLTAPVIPTWIITTVAVFGTVSAVALTWYIIYEAKKSRVWGKTPVAESDGRSMTHTLVGRVGYVSKEIDRYGVVAMEDETWTASSEDGGVIAEGMPVVVVNAHGLHVTVKPITQDNSPKETPRGG